MDHSIVLAAPCAILPYITSHSVPRMGSSYIGVGQLCIENCGIKPARAGRSKTQIKGSKKKEAKKKGVTDGSKGYKKKKKRGGVNNKNKMATRTGWWGTLNTERRVRGRRTEVGGGVCLVSWPPPPCAKKDSGSGGWKTSLWNGWINGTSPSLCQQGITAAAVTALAAATAAHLNFIITAEEHPDTPDCSYW